MAVVRAARGNAADLSRRPPRRGVLGRAERGAAHRGTARGPGLVDHALRRPDLGLRRRRARRGRRPLGEHVPARTEADASGAAAGVVAAGSPEFDALVRLDDPTVVVKDEEGSGADRMMTPRLAELVGVLAAHVAQAFPGRRLRLTEAWDPDGEHSHSSLHYEGRAADLTVDDRDRAKLGRLAALAVQTGFDWVLHENDHVHVSVRAG
ncbi:D-Ala-D-Ala carboxypeptidase family metallohydrolase [Pseudonocardia benzenivorans]